MLTGGLLLESKLFCGRFNRVWTYEDGIIMTNHYNPCAASEAYKFARLQVIELSQREFQAFQNYLSTGAQFEVLLPLPESGLGRTESAISGPSLRSLPMSAQRDGAPFRCVCANGLFFSEFEVKVSENKQKALHKITSINSFLA